MLGKKNSDHEQLAGTTRYAQVVRQDRYESDGKLSVETESFKFEVRNFSLFGLAIASTEDLPLDRLFAEGKLFYDKELLGEYSFVIKRKSVSGPGWEYGLECITDSIPVTKIQQVGEIRTSLRNIQDYADRQSILPHEFRCLVQELGARLKRYEKMANSIENRAYQSKIEKEDAFEVAIEMFGPAIFEDIQTTNFKLQKIVQHEGEAALKNAFTYFRDILGDYIYQSPFTRRSFEKPRGYAGDFEMMSQIYRNDNHAEQLFGSCMEKAVQLHAEPTAVRNRTTFLADKIHSTIRSTTGKVRILAVACGPAEEVRKAIREIAQKDLDRVEFFLLDQDEDALKFAQRNIRTEAVDQGKQINLTLLNQGIKEVILKGSPGENYDLIYSAGLFDYFSDPVATRAGRALAKSLAQKGQLVIGNFNITSPNWFGMMTLFDWHLILRGEADLGRIFNLEGFQLRVEAEPENVNLFCVITPL